MHLLLLLFQTFWRNILFCIFIPITVRSCQYFTTKFCHILYSTLLLSSHSILQLSYIIYFYSVLLFAGHSSCNSFCSILLFLFSFRRSLNFQFKLCYSSIPRYCTQVTKVATHFILLSYFLLLYAGHSSCNSFHSTLLFPVTVRRWRHNEGHAIW